MKKDQLWFGYLEAGEKSSPVVKDSALDTTNPKTVYLFNLARATILEYSREIVEPKLRELSAQDKVDSDALVEAYAEARQSFTPRGRITSIPERAAPTPKKAVTIGDELDDIDTDSDDLIDDDEAWEEDEV